ncbi:MAG: Gfo/Idh/MocA family oxidoreductase [Verrucomicrobiae bacterium]
MIGCGQIAESHLRGFLACGAEVIAFADAVLERAEAMAGKSPGGHAYPGYQELITEAGVDAIIICTPPNLHREISVAALERNLHVLCEKPLAATLEDSLAIERAAASSRSTFMTAFRHRFLPAHQSMKKILATSGLGKPVIFQNIFGGPSRESAAKWFCNQAIAGGGVFLDTCVHGVDLFRFYCGEIQVCSGQSVRDFSGTSVEDSGVMTLRSQGGTLGTISGSWNIGTWRMAVEVLTENGRVLYDYAAPTQILVEDGDGKIEFVPTVKSDGFQEQAAYFLSRAASGSPAEPGAIDGRRAVEVIAGLYNY